MRTLLLVVIACLGLMACGEREHPEIVPGVSADAVHPVVAGYALLVRASYALTGDRAKAMQDAIAVLTEDPSEAHLAAARGAWRSAREVYGVTEAFRFYGGPIDHAAAGVEHLINSWPVDEGAIESGRMNEPEKRRVTGWHAVAFLLWGPDPRSRPASDFQDSERGAQLHAVSTLLVSQIEQLEDAWTPTVEERRYISAWLELDELEALTRIFTGIVTLAADEVSERRLRGARETKDPRRVHARFSGSTRADLLANLRGIEAVYAGRHGQINRPALDTLVMLVDPELDAAIKRQFEATQAALEALPEPLRPALSGGDDAAGRAEIKTAVDETLVLARLLTKAARALGVTRDLTTGP